MAHDRRISGYSFEPDDFNCKAHYQYDVLPSPKTLSEELDREVLRIAELVRCLENLERRLEPGRQSKQPTLENEQTNCSTSCKCEDCNTMERSRRSGIPLPSGARKKPPVPARPARPVNPVMKDSQDSCLDIKSVKMEDDNTYSESVSVKTAAHMFGGQAVIRRIPTPSTKRSLPPTPSNRRDVRSPTPPAATGGKIRRDVGSPPPLKSSLRELKSPTPSEISKSGKLLETNVDDAIEELMKGTSNIDENMEVCENSEAKCSPCESINYDNLRGNVSNLHSGLSSYSKVSETDYTILGTISPLTDCGNLKPRNGSADEMSFVFGRPVSPVSETGGLKRCVSPEYERRPLSPATDVIPAAKKLAGYRHPPVLPHYRGGENIRHGVGISCERCNNCLIDLKRQALRLMYPDNLQGAALSMPVDSIGRIEENLQLPENNYKFLKNGRCDVCETHICQLKQEAVAMVQSIQRAQSESTSLPTNIPALVGSINLTSPHRNGTTSGVGYYQRHPRSVKSSNGPPGGFKSSSSAPLAAQAQAYLEQNVHAWVTPKRHHGQMLVRSASQDYGRMYSQTDMMMGPDHALVQGPYGPQGQYGRPYYAQQGSQYMAPPYMHPSMQQYYPPSSPGGARISSPPPSGQGFARVSSPPPPSPSLSRISSPISPPMSPPPNTSPAASFFARAAQKLNKKKKRHQQPEPEPPPFPTRYHEIIRYSPPPCPPCLIRANGRQHVPGMGKVKVMLRIVSSSQHGEQASSFLSIDPSSKQVAIYDPAAIGYATAAHRRAASAPKMFAFDAVFSPDVSLTEICASSVTDIVQGVVAGADGCLFTYGYSRVGKSLTMLGRDDSSQNLGIVPCAITWLFKLITDQKEKTGARFSVRVSAVEVSGKQEVLKDLLAEVAQGTEAGLGTAPGVYLREDPICGTQLENQSELRAPSADKAAYYLDAALAARSQDEEDEGRSSHLLFTLHVYQYRIEKTNTKAGLPGVAGGRSRLHLIDLGSSSKSKDPSNVSLSLSALGNVIMALLNGQRHVPHRDSKVAQLLRDSLGNISCRTCMIAHVSSAVPHYNETLQVVQLAARIHRMKRRKTRFSSTSSDDSSTDDGRLRTRPFRGFRMGTLREDALCGSSLSDPDYTSSSEQSCDTVIYLGASGQSLSDRELTDHEGPPRSVPRTNPRLPRRPSGSRSSGDEGSNSDSGRSLSHSDFRLRTNGASMSRLQARMGTPVRDFGPSGSRQGTPVREVGQGQGSRNATPVREIQMSNEIMQTPPMSPNLNVIQLPRKMNTRSKSVGGAKVEEGSPQHYASVNVVEKVHKSNLRIKRTNSDSNAPIEGEQWIDGPGAAIYPDKKKVPEMWVDGPQAFVVKQEAVKSEANRAAVRNQKISSEEQWVDGPKEMIAGSEIREQRSARETRSPMHTSSKKAHVRDLSQEKGSPSSPARTPAKPSWHMHEIKERPESTISIDSSASNKAQASDSRPTSVVSEIDQVGQEAEATQDTSVKPFVRDWVERHSSAVPSGKVETEGNIGFIMNSENQVIGSLEMASSYRKSKPHDSRSKKLAAPSSSTPKHSPHHSPRQSPAVPRKQKASTPKVPKSQLPAPTNPTKRVTEWLKCVDSNHCTQERTQEVLEIGINTDPDQDFEIIAAGNLNTSQDVSSCSTMYPDTTLNESHVQDVTDVDNSENKTVDTTAECNIADISFDSSIDTNELSQTSQQNRESIYEMQVDETLENALCDISDRNNDVSDDDTFSNASCTKDSEMEVVGLETIYEAEDSISGDMKKSDTLQSIKTLVGENSQNMSVGENIICDKLYEHGLLRNEPSPALSEYDNAVIDCGKHALSRKPDGASCPNLLNEMYSEPNGNLSIQREEYLVANAMSSHSEIGLKSSRLPSASCSVNNTLSRAADGSCSKPPIPQKQCVKAGSPLQKLACGHYSSCSKASPAKLCKDCQKLKNLNSNSNSLHSGRGREKDKSAKQRSNSECNGSSSPTNSSTLKSSSSKSSKSHSPSHSRLPIFSSKNSPASSKDLKSSRRKDKESKSKVNNGRVSELVTRSPSRSHDSDSGNDSGIVTTEKSLLSPYATVTKPRTVSHSSSGHGSDNSSTMSAELHSKQGSTSDKLHGGTSSGYESMLRDSEVSGSSTAQEDSASEVSSSEKKKGSKKKRLPSTRRSRSAPSRSSESPESGSRKSSPSSKNSSLSPTSKAWLDSRHHKLKDDAVEIKDYDCDDVRRLQRRRLEEEQTLRKNQEKLKELLTKEQEASSPSPNGKEHYIVERSNWTFDCKFLMCFSCRSRPQKTDV